MEMGTRVSGSRLTVVLFLSFSYPISVGSVSSRG